jgi:hypothetical protein
MPIHFLRYEDLLLDPKPTLVNLFRFILGVESLEGTVMMKRIDDILSKGQEATHVYKPKQDSEKSSAEVTSKPAPKAVKNKSKFKEETLKLTQKSKYQNTANYFGYLEQEAGNTQVNCIDLNKAEKCDQNYEQFRIDNEKAIQMIINQREKVASNTYHFIKTPFNSLGFQGGPPGIHSHHFTIE